jgi:hypothetical protein
VDGMWIRKRCVSVRSVGPAHRVLNGATGLRLQAVETFTSTRPSAPFSFAVTCDP